MAVVETVDIIMPYLKPVMRIATTDISGVYGHWCQVTDRAVAAARNSDLSRDARQRLA